MSFWTLVVGCLLQAVVVLAFLPSCGAPQAGRARPDPARMLDVRQDDSGPTLVLVQRQGDPAAGIALVVRIQPPDSGGLVAGLLEARLPSADGWSIERRFHSVTAARTTSSPDATSAAIAQLYQALALPVTTQELRTISVTAGAPGSSSDRATANALASCSDAPPALPSSAPLSLEELQSWATQLTEQKRSVVAVVGSAAHLSAAKRPTAPRLVENLRQAAEQRESAALHIAAESQGVPQLAIMLQPLEVGTADQLLRAVWRQRASWELSLRSSMPAWRLEHTSVHLVPGGACLRVDLQGTDVPPSVDAIQSTSSVLLGELQRLLEKTPPINDWNAARRVAEQTNPRAAAALAARAELFRSTESAAPPLPQAAYHGPVASDSPPKVARLQPRVPAGWLRKARQLELGQGHFWLLLASPCGTAPELPETAGGRALAMHLAAASHSDPEVHIEPWISSDGVGLIARTTALSSEQEPIDRANAVAEALARSLLRSSHHGLKLASSRDRLTRSASTPSHPRWLLALKRATQGHTSWLIPHGTEESIELLSADQVWKEKAAWLQEPLRVASISTQSPQEAAAAESRLEALLGPARAGSLQGQCPRVDEPTPQPGHYRLPRRSDPDELTAILLALPVADRGLPTEAYWTELLMNRPGGWLERALTAPGLAGRAEARVLGGGHAAALAIELRSASGHTERAVAQIRGLLQRLHTGAATAADAQWAATELQRLRAEQRIDPRARLVELWHGRGSPPGNLAGLRALHREAFRPGGAVIVSGQVASE